MFYNIRLILVRHATTYYTINLCFPTLHPIHLDYIIIEKLLLEQVDGE